LRATLGVAGGEGVEADYEAAYGQKRIAQRIGLYFDADYSAIQAKWQVFYV
jgi:hypothetical protein